MLLRFSWRMPYYAVAKGKNTGIFGTWDECQSQVKGFSGAIYKKFKTQSEAEQFITEKSGPVQKKRKIEYTGEDGSLNVLESVSHAPEKKQKSPARKKPLIIPPQPPPPSSSSSANKFDKIKSELPRETTLKKFGSNLFSVDANGFVHVFTDGSCEGNGSKMARAGFGVYFGKHHPLNASEPVRGKPTNNAGEIQAAIKAIEVANESQVLRLNIFTDSQFVMKSVCQWMPKWKLKGWKLGDGTPVKNQIDFERLDKLIDSVNMLIKWSYIPAHKGHHGNEEADRLAKEGAQRYLP